MEAKPQNFANHVRFDPPFHFFVLPAVAINMIVSVVQIFRHFSLGNAWLLILALAAAVAVVRFRLYATQVQDRIIRLEERIRLQSVLPQPLRSRIGELPVTQLIGLRFASDAELPALTERALKENLSCKDIKRAVTSWRADKARV